MRYLLLLFCLVLAACDTPIMNTSQELTLDLIGTDRAYCIISTDANRYALHAPGTLFVERDSDDLKIDCDDDYSDRRRVMIVESSFGFGYWDYPEEVTVDFSTLDNGTRFSGYRAEADIMPSSGATVTEVLTEDSFSLPVETSQQYPVAKDHHMGRRSYPLMP